MTRKWLVNGLLLVVATGLGLVVAEGGLRLVYPQPLGVWHHTPEGLPLHWPRLVTYLPQFGQSVSFNSVGMRDREHAIAKPPGVFRIMVLGDSFMEALQIPFEASFPHLLERRLERETARSVEIVNASVSGWGTDDELQYLLTQGLNRNPDLVLVVMTLHNDISDNLRERFHTIRNGSLVQEPREATSFAMYKLLELKGFLATRSHAYQLLMRARRVREMRGEERQLNSFVVNLFRDEMDERMGRGVQLTRLLLERMRSVTAARGSRIVLVLIPLAVQISDTAFAEFARAIANAGTTTTLRLTRPQTLMTRVAESVDVPVIDLLPGFREWAASDGTPLYFEREGHWNVDGHRLAMIIVAHQLIDRNFVPHKTGSRRASAVEADFGRQGRFGDGHERRGAPS